MGFVMLANVHMMPEFLSPFEEGLFQLCRCWADSREEENALSDSTWFSQFVWLANLIGFSFGRALSAVILYPKGLNNWLGIPATCSRLVRYSHEETVYR